MASLMARVAIALTSAALAVMVPLVLLPVLSGPVTTGWDLALDLFDALVSGIQALPEYRATVTDAAAAESVTAVMEEATTGIYLLVALFASLFSYLAAFLRVIFTVPGDLVAFVWLVHEDIGLADRVFLSVLFGIDTSPITLGFVLPYVLRLYSLSYYHLVERPAKLRELREQEEAFGSRIERLRPVWEDYEYVIGKGSVAIRRIRSFLVQSQKAQEQLWESYRTAPKFEIPNFPQRRLTHVGAANRSGFSSFVKEVRKLAFGPAIATLDNTISEFEEIVGINRSAMDLLSQDEKEVIEVLTATEQQLDDCRRDETMRRNAAAFEAETATGRWRYELRDEYMRQPYWTRNRHHDVVPARSPITLPRTGIFAPRRHVAPVAPVANPPAPEVVDVQEERPAAAVDAAVPPVVDEPIAAANEPIAASPVVIEESPATPVVPVPVQVAVVVPDQANAHLVEASEQREQALPQPEEQYWARQQEEWNARLQQQFLEQQENELRQAIAAEQARQAHLLSTDRLRADFASAHQENTDRMSAWREQMRAQRAAEKTREAAEAEARARAEATEREAAARRHAEEEALRAASEAAEAEQTRRVREAEAVRLAEEARFAEAERVSSAFAEGLRLADEAKLAADNERLAAEAKRRSEAERLLAVHAAAKFVADETARLEEAEREAEAEEDRLAEIWEEEQAELRALAGFESQVEASLAVRPALAQHQTDRLRQAEEEESGEALFLSPGQQVLSQQRSELALIQAQCQALQEEGFGSDVSSDSDVDMDISVSSLPDTTAAPGPVVDENADSAHEATLDEFAEEETRAWFAELWPDIPYNADADMPMEYLKDSSDEDAGSDMSEDGVEWEDVVVKATSSAPPSTPVPGRRILPAKAVNSQRVQTKLNYELDRQSGLLDALRQGLSGPTPSRENIGQGSRLADDDALKLVDMRASVSPAQVSHTPEEKKEADRLARTAKLRAQTERINEQAKLDKMKNALARSARPKPT